MVVKVTSQFLKSPMRGMDHLARYDEHRFALLVPTASWQNTCPLVSGVLT